MKNIKALTFLIIGLLSAAYSQSARSIATFSGTVTNISGEGLAAATIAIEGINSGGIADQEGNFFIENIPPGTYTVKVTFLGYLSFSEELSFKAGQNVKKNFSLREDALNLEAVVISGTRYEQDRVKNPEVENVVD